MKKIKKQNLRKEMRKRRTRAKIFGTKARPRLSVFRSNKFTYTQLIDDENGRTLVSASTREMKIKGTKKEKAAALGEKLAEKAKTAKIKTATLDRGSYQYHGRVRAVTEGARKGGLKLLK